MLEVDYEQVVDDLEGNARRIITYCELEWDNACLSLPQVQAACANRERAPGPPTDLHQLGWPLARLPRSVEAASRGAARAVSGIADRWETDSAAEAAVLYRQRRSWMHTAKEKAPDDAGAFYSPRLAQSFALTGRSGNSHQL